MRIIRAILLFFALILGFVMLGELFQTQIFNFDKAYYRAMKYDVEKEKKDTFLSELLEAADKNGVSVFAAKENTASDYLTECTIYGDRADVRAELEKTVNINEGIYTSIFSGQTEIKFADFMELNSDDDYITYISFIGDDGQIDRVYDEISKSYDVSYPEYMESTERDMVAIVWVMIAVLMAAMTCIEVIRRKKETVVRLSLGESAPAIIAKAVMADAGFYLVAFFSAKLLTDRLASGAYELDFATAIFFVGMICSLVPYVAFNFFDVRKAFSNAGDAKAIPYIMYAVKIFAVAITVFTLTTNIGSIEWSAFSDGGFLTEYETGTYFRLRALGNDSYENEEKFWKDVYTNEYKTLKPVICSCILDDKTDYIFVNENASGMLQGLGKYTSLLKADSDLAIFVPEGLDGKLAEETARSVLELFVQTDKNASVQVIEYGGREKFSYLSAQSAYGIETSINPVVIFSNTDNITFNSESFSYMASETIYMANESQIDKICSRYSELLDGFEVVKTNVGEYMDYRFSFVTRLVQFLSSLCIVVFVLDIAVIVAMCSMEFRNNSMEISIKKICGYSVFERNRKIIFVNIIADVLVMAMLCLFSGRISNFDITIGIVIGAAVLVTELIIIIFNIIKLEKENIHKILKGGCL